MRVLDLFSGIGGFSLGLERAGMHTIAFCERDEFCQAVLRKHWPSIPIFGDVRAIDAGGLGRLGRIDLVCGGFPCQPFSVAGRRAAHNDDRYLWPEMRQVIALTRPTWVLAENVTGIVSVALDTVLADLESDGYAARAITIPACAVGAHHERNRAWILAHVDGSELRHQPGRRSGESRQDEAQSSDNGEPRATSHLNGAGSQVGLVRPRIQSEARRRNDGQDAALDPWGASASAVVRGLHGIPRRMDRIRALGNAVVPQVVEEIGRAIMQLEKTRPGYNLDSGEENQGIAWVDGLAVPQSDG